MKLRIIVAVLLVVTAWVAGRHFYGAGGGATLVSHSASPAAEATGAAEQNVDESYRLNPGARVEVSGINGPVEIVTADVDTAEVHLINKVSDARFMENHKVVVEHSPDRLSVRAQNKKTWGPLRWLLGGSGKATQSVRLVLPRQVELRASGISGQLRVGELDGSLKVSGVDGRVEVAQATGRAEVSGVNGGVSVGVARLGAEGVRVGGVNGRVELRFAADVNADVRAGGVNGGIDSSGLRNVSVEEEGRGRFTARVGTGGSPVKLGGINGGVVLRSY